MRKKIMWLVLSCLMVAVLVLASCGPAAEEGEGKTVVGKVVEKEEKVVEEKEETVTPVEKGPQYGGTLTILQFHAIIEPAAWDPAAVLWSVDCYTSPYLEKLTIGDFEKYGPRGTNEFPFSEFEFIPPQYQTGQLAESWEMTDPLKMVFHLRKGVYFQDRPGIFSTREVTAEDVAFCINRYQEASKLPLFEYWEGASATDKYTVVLEYSKYSQNWMLFNGWWWGHQIYPPELAEQMNDWHYAVGTGPFILEDYVSGASLTFTKNPNYWGKSTIDGKEYQLPFVDTMVWPLIPDESTQLAALRTGKCDINERVTWKYIDSLAKTNPELVSYRWLDSTGTVVALKLTDPPLDDIRARKALSMAIDRQAMIDSQMGGEGVILSFPFSSEWGDDLYTPLEELPESTQEMFTYNPEKAKQLMTEAGYPDGFSTEMVCIADPFYVDSASMAASFWEENLNIDVEIKPVEYGTYYSIMGSRSYNHFYHFSKGCAGPFTIMQNLIVPGFFWNVNEFSSDYTTETYAKARMEPDPAVAKQYLKEMNVYLLEQCLYVILPMSYWYSYGWPWVKNWYGEVSAGVRSPGHIYSRIWIDQNMKKTMGY